jgi:hypothetical protein
MLEMRGMALPTYRCEMHETRAEVEQMPDDKVDQPQDETEENVSASVSEIDTGINFSNLPQPGPTSDDSSLRHEMRNMTAVLAQLVTRIDSQDQKGHATIIEREPQEAVARAMVTHPKNWAMQANALVLKMHSSFTGQYSPTWKMAYIIGLIVMHSLR